MKLVKIIILTLFSILVSSHASATCTQWELKNGACVDGRYGQQPDNGEYHGTTQDNPQGSIYDSRKDKPRPKPRYTPPSCTYQSPCCGKKVDGALNWAYPSCP